MGVPSCARPQSAGHIRPTVQAQSPRPIVHYSLRLAGDAPAHTRPAPRSGRRRRGGAGRCFGRHPSRSATAEPADAKPGGGPAPAPLADMAAIGRAVPRALTEHRVRRVAECVYLSEKVQAGGRSGHEVTLSLNSMYMSHNLIPTYTYLEIRSSS